MKTFSGYSKSLATDLSVLLAGGGTKELSKFSMDGHNHNDLYVTSVAVTDDATNHANQLRFVKNGTSTYFTVPYATNADTANFVTNRTLSITVTGDSNTYYPVVLPGPGSKTGLNIISVWKNLGSTTASYANNHSNGTSSCWYMYEGRVNYWDGNGGYYRTLRAWYGYAPLCAQVEAIGGPVGSLTIWLRGGGTEYNISCNFDFSTPQICYSKTNIGSSSPYERYVEPRTTIGNAGVIDGTFYGNCTGSAGSVAWSNISSQPETATRWPSWSEVTDKPSTFTPASHTHSYLPLSGGDISGAISIKGTTASGAYSQGGYNQAYNNILLYGDSTYGVSGITFYSYKGSTNINNPSDVAFIQYHAYGVTASAYNTTPTEASSGEKGRLVIGIGNDTGSDYGEEVWLQTPGANDLKHYVVNTAYTILDSGNYSSWAAPASHSHNYLATLGSASGSSHAEALKNWFDSNKASTHRNVLINFYSSAYSNGSQYFGYFLSGYDSNPYGGFYVAHYNTPYYVGISNGSYTQWELSRVGHTHDYLSPTSSNRLGVYKLFRRDDNSNYSVQTDWTGTYWRLRGYNGDTYHAGCQVAYADSAGTLNGMTRNASNNWSGTGLTLLMGMSDSSGGDCLFLTNNSGLMSFCIDGCLYLRIDSTGSSRRCLDTYDLSNTTWGTATYSTYTTYLNASYTIGASSWDWNPFGATLYYIWGLQFKIPSVSSDTGDMRLYLSPSPPGCGGLGVCLNMDGYISTLSLMYAGNGFYTGSDRRFKRNIKNIKGTDLLPLKSFVIKSTNKASYGFIAQEMQELGYPELVEEGDNGMLSVNYNAALSLAVAKLNNVVTELRLKIKELEKQLGV